MVYRGRILNGVAVLEGDAKLPEGTEVLIQPAEQSAKTRTLSERFANVIGACPDLPQDMARNHDHYLHGTPKR